MFDAEAMLVPELTLQEAVVLEEVLGVTLDVTMKLEMVLQMEGALEFVLRDVPVLLILRAVQVQSVYVLLLLLLELKRVLPIQQQSPWDSHPGLLQALQQAFLQMPCAVQCLRLVPHRAWVVLAQHVPHLGLRNVLQ